MIKKVENYFNELRKNDKYNYFLMRKLYSKHKDVLNYNTIDKIEYEEFFKPYLSNNNLLEFLEVALDDLDFRNNLDYYEIRTLQTIIYMSKKDNKKTYNLKEADNMMKMLEFYIKVKKLFKSKSTNDNKNFIDKLKEEEDPLYVYDINDYKIITSIVCDNNFLKKINEKYLNQDTPYYIIKKVIEVLELSINIHYDYELGIKINVYFEYISKEKIRNYNASDAEKYLNLLLNKLNNKVFYLSKL